MGGRSIGHTPIPEDVLAWIYAVYQAVIAALARTLELQAALDDAVDTAGGWPLH